MRPVPQLSLVVPCFNEEAVLDDTSRRLEQLVDELSHRKIVTSDSQIIFVDDGSRDATWTKIEQLCSRSRQFAGLKLSRNRGHQNAVLAGLLAAPGDVVISIDADLQDDLRAVETMLAEYRAGADIVYGVRSDRTSDSWFKRTTAEGYYSLLGAMGVDIVHNHADYRLLSRRALDALESYNEVNLFLRGIIPQLGFRTAVVPYVRGERLAGETKYPLRRMLALGFEGITSFSVRPLRWIGIFGAAVSALSFVAGLWSLAMFLSGQTLPGWASTAIPLFFMGGVQLLSIGIIGEYLGRVYLETKARPRYHVEEVRNIAPQVDKDQHVNI